MHLYHDSYTASVVAAGYPSAAIPIMPSLTMSPPATEFVVTNPTNLLNWQYIPGEGDTGATQSQILNVVNNYYAFLDDAQDNTNPQVLQSIQSLFIPLDYDLPQAQAHIYVPGDPNALEISGLFVGIDMIAEYHQRLLGSVDQVTPNSDTYATYLVDEGSVVVSWNWRGTHRDTELEFEVDAIDYFQIIESEAGALRIARLTRFFDTWNVTMAYTNKLPFPHHLNYDNDCCQASDLGSCANAEVTACVCDYSPNCCAQEWNEECVSFTSIFCSFSCNGADRIYSSVSIAGLLFAWVIKSFLF